MYPNVSEHSKHGVHMCNVFKWFFLLLLAVLAGVVSPQDCIPCPAECQCIPQSISESSSSPVSCVVDCELQSLSSLPTIDPSLGSNVVQLIYSSNSISNFAADSFDAFPNLQVLKLEDNNLSSLPVGCLDKLTKLQILDVSNNVITSLDVNIFQQLTSLEELYLHGNKINNLPDGLFAGSTTINTLTLNGNQISFLQDDIFTNLDKLETLNFSDNQLTSLSNVVFDGLNKLSNVHIGNNPFVCECSLQGLQNWIDQFTGTVDTVDVTCYEPYYLAGQQLVDLSSNDLVCITGYVHCEVHDNTKEVIFYDPQINTANYNQASCNEKCYLLGYPYAAVAETLQCLCGNIQQDVLTNTCGSSCEDTTVSIDCQRYVFQDGFATSACISLDISNNAESYLMRVTFSVNTTIPVNIYEWNFSDNTALLNTTDISVEHKFALPTTHTVLVTVYTDIKTDVCSHKITLHSQVQGSLQCPKNIIDTSSSANIAFLFDKGTDIKIAWIPSGYVENAGNVETFVTGIYDFGYYPFDDLPSSTTTATPTQTVVAILPGMFFEHTGKIISWEFVSLGSLSNEELHLQVYAQSCPSGQILLQPGCIELCSPFAVCIQPENSPNCSNYDVNQCMIEPPRFQYGTQPQYELKSDVTIHITSTETTHYQVQLSTMIDVDQDDVIGVQYATTQPIHCSDQLAENSPNSVLQGTASTWLSVGSQPDNLNTWIDSKDYAIRAIYTQPLEYISNDPAFSPPNLSTGEFTFVAQIQTKLNTISGLCKVTFADKIKSLTFIHPPIQESGISENSGGTIFLEKSQTIFLTVLVISGSDLSSEWTFEDVTFPVNFTSSCPTAIAASVPQCNPTTVPSTTSYAYYEKTYDTLGNYLLQVMVDNPINTRSTTVDIVVQERITGLDIQRTTVLALVGYELVFTANVGSGTSVTYLWSKDSWDTAASTGDRPEFWFTFTQANNYTMSVNASNALNSAVASIDLVVIGMQPLANLMFLSAETVISSKTEILFQIQFQGDQYYNVTVSWNFDDESLVFEDTITPSIGPTTVSTTHTYNSAGNFTINVTVFNQYDSLATQLAINVIDSITAVSITSSKVIAATHQLITFQAYISGTISPPLYSWTVAKDNQIQDNVQQSEPILSMSFDAPGNYEIKVEASNPVSSANASLFIKVEEAITGLTVICDDPNPNQVNALLFFTVTVSTGSDIMYTFDTGVVGEQTIRDRDDPFFNWVYSEVGTYTFTVYANNSISYEKTEVEIVILETFSLNDIEFPKCTGVNDPVEISAIVGKNSDTTLQYTWNFGDSSPVDVNSNQTVSHIYNSAGSFTVSITAEDSESHSQTVSRTLCVEEVLTTADVELQHTSVAVVGESTSISLMFLQSTTLQVEWHIDDQLITNISAGELSHTFNNPGQYVITVYVSNQVSTVTISSSIQAEEAVAGINLYVAGLEGSIMNDNDNDILYVTTGNENVFNASVQFGSDVIFTWNFGIDNAMGASVSFVYSSTGVYDLTLTASNQVSSENRTFQVHALDPITGLSIDIHGSDVISEGESINITATITQGNEVTFSWQVCSPCTSPVLTTDNNYVHQLTKTGVYTVKLTASNNISTSPSVETSVTVLGDIEGLKIYSDLVEGLYAVTDSVYPYNFTANVTSGVVQSYHWSVKHYGSELHTSDNQDMSYTFNIVGQHKIGVLAANVINDKTDFIIAEAMEVVTGFGISSNASGSIVAVGEPILYEATYDTGTNLTFQWQFDYDGFVTDVPYTVYTWKNPGSFMVFVAFINKVSSETAYTHQIVQELITGITIVLDTSTGYYVAIDQTVAYTANTTTGSNMVYEWTFPDTYYTRTVSHTFTSLGVFQVSVKATNDLNSDETMEDITVEEPVTGLQLGTVVDTVATGTEIEFTATIVSGSSVIYIWSVSTDPGSPVEKFHGNFNYTFTTVGVHTVSVTAKNGLGSETDSVDITVQEIITGLEIIDCCNTVYASNEEITFEAKVATGSDVLYVWEVDNTEMKGQQIKVTFTWTGQHTIKLLASNLLSNETITDQVTVQERIQNLRIETSGIETLYSDYDVTFTLHVDSGNSILYTMDYGDLSGLQHSTHNVFIHSFKAPRTYQVNAHANNSLGVISAKTNVTIQLLLCSEPKLLLIGPYNRQVRRSNDIYIEYDINLNWCLKYTTVYEWKVFETMNCSLRYDMEPISLPAYVNTGVPLLHLRGHTLEYGEYCLEFSAKFEDTPLISVDSLRLSILSSPLVAVISGGRIRTTSVQDTLVLDASESYDPDLPADEQTSLDYEWTCTGSPSSSGTGTESTDSVCFSGTLTESEIIIEAGKLTADVTYTFELTVSKVDRTSGNSKQKVIVKENTQPSVSISCRTCHLQPRVSVSASHRVSMRGRCSNCFRTQVTYEWSVVREDNEVLELNMETTTTGGNSPNLVIRKGAIVNGYEYTFVLTVTDKYNTKFSEPGYAEMRLPPNEPPSGGTCVVSPDQTIALEGMLDFECQDWYDEDNLDEPLRYSVVVQRRTDNSEAEAYILYWGTQQKSSVTTPVGLDILDNIIYVNILVEDRFGVHTVGYNGTLEVLLPVLDNTTLSMSQWLYEKSINELQFFRQTHDPQKVTAYGTALVTVLNAESKHADSTDFQYRVDTRTNIIESVTELKISTMTVVKQISSVLVQSTSYLDELLSTMTFDDITITLMNILLVTDDFLDDGEDPEGIPADSVLTVISNVIDALNLYIIEQDKLFDKVYIDEKERQALILNFIIQAQKLLSLLVRAKVIHELPAQVASPGIQGVGQRSNQATASLLLEVNGCKFEIPSGLFNVTVGPDVEFLEVMMCNNKNPYTWGTANSLNITSRVQMLEYRNNDGTLIPIKDLDESQRITMKMQRGSKTSKFLNLLNDLPFSKNNTRIDSFACDPQTNMMYMSVEVLPILTGAFMLSDLPKSFIPSSMHIQVRYTPMNDKKEPKHESSITVYLGILEEPTEDNYIEMLTITEEDMDSDHTSYTFFISEHDYDPNDMYYLLLTNNYKQTKVNVSMGVYFSSCQFYNETVNEWESSGCSPLEQSMASCTVCSCSHLTSFGSSAASDLVSVDFIGWRANTNTSIVAVITLCAVSAIYLVAVLVARWRDGVDLRRVGIVPLCGKEASFKYEITVKTGMRRGAGTSAHVGINMYGEHGKSGTRHLSKAGAFVRNSLDMFLVATDTHLGDIWKIRIWHDNTGLNPCWYLSRVMIRDLHTDKKFYFICGQWLTLTSENSMVKKEFMSADSAQLSKFSTIFSAEVIRGFSERHLWFSVYERPLRSWFTRVQRVTCCTTLAFLLLCLNSLWYGQIHQETRVEWISWHEGMIGLLTAAVGLIIVLIVGEIFRNTRYKVTVLDYSNKPMTAQTVEMDALCELSQTGGSVIAFGGQGNILKAMGTAGACIKHCDSFRHLPQDETTAALACDDDDDDDEYDEDEDFLSSFHNNNVKLNKLGWPVPTKSKSPTLPELGPLEKGKWWSYESILSWPEELPSHDGSLKVKKAGTHVKRTQSGARKQGVAGTSNGLDKQDDSLEELINDIDDVPTTQHQRSHPKLRRTKFPTSHKTNNLTKDTFTPRADPDLTHTSCHPSQKIGSAGSSRSRPHDEGETVNNTGSTDGLYTAVSTTMSTLESSKPNTFMSGKGNPLKERERSRTHLRSSTGNRNSSKRRKCYLPSCFLYVNYITCFVLCAGSVGLTLYYGNKFSVNQAVQWLIAVSIAFTSSIFLLEPLKVVAIAFFCAICRRPLDDYSDDDIIDDPIVKNLEGPSHNIKPPGGYALIQAKEEAKKITIMYSLLKQFVVWILFVWLVLMVNYMDNGTMHQYARTWTLNNTYVGTKYDVEDGKNFHSIRIPEDFWLWSNTVLARALHSAELDPFDEESSYAYNRPVGIARLRQIRTLPVDCLIQSTKYKDVDMYKACISDSEVDRKSYSEGWVYDPNVNQTWVYSSEDQLDGMSITGQVNTYTGGGYVQELGISYSETTNILQHLQDNQWIDRWTSAVFVEFTVYSQNKHLYSIVNLLVEFPSSGSALPSVSIMTVRLSYYGNNHILTAFMIIFVLFMVAFLVREIFNMKELGWSYLSSVWHWIDIVIIALGFSIFGLYIFQQLYTASVVDKYFSNQDRFTNFYRAAYYIDLITVLNAIILMLVFLKLLRLVRFSRPMNLYLKTLSEAARYIFCLMIIFLIVLWAYGNLSYLVYGSLIWGLHTLGSSLVALLGLMRGPSIDLDLCLEYYPVLTPLMFSFFWFIFCVIIASLFAAIIINSYKDVKEKAKKPCLELQDYEMVEFIMKRFKQMLGLSKVKEWRPKVKFHGLESLSSHSRSRCSTRLSSRLSSAGSSSGFQSLYMERWDPEQINDIIRSLSPAVDEILQKFDEVQMIANEEDSLIKTWSNVEQKRKERKTKEAAKASKQRDTKPQPAPRTKRQRRISVPDKPNSATEKKSALVGRPKSEQSGRGEGKTDKKSKVTPVTKKAW
ncbi:polycystin-1-like [Glandiceps talaboti]